MARPLRRAALALAMLSALAVAAPASADTESELDAAKARVADVRARLASVTAEWQATETRLAETQAAVDQARARIAELEARLDQISLRLDRRVRAIYIAGGNGTLGVLLDSATFTDFADRLQFATNIAQGDEDLATEVAVQSEQLDRERARFVKEAKAQAEAAQALEGQKASIGGILEEAQALYDELYQEFKEEQQRQAIGLPAPTAGGGPFPAGGSGAISICPVQGPVSFVDSFGWPRPGGRTHQGIDMISPYGTPIVATHAGNAVRAPNTLGGNAVILYHEGSSDWTYYAHMSSYGAEGAVSAGTVIGYVGATGDTSVNHLHFEYHPGGGSAINPYGMLLAVC
jgi:murein DD-endopeptidase MepM/ murein hydrolase activator NlpD